TFDRLAGAIDSVGACREQAQEVLSRRDAVRARFDALRALASGGRRMRVHGDYHLGQVLRVEEDFVILDFEGEPARPIAERRAKQSPLKDVAGMIRSFGYAAHAALIAWTVHHPATYPALESWAETWRKTMSQAFVEGYRHSMDGDPDASGLTPDRDAWGPMLCAFVMDKALYEVGYELDHRPDWIRIPLIGILKLLS